MGATLFTLGLVVLVATLLSGAIDKSGLPHVALFLLLGAVLGPSGAALLDAPLDSELLRIVSTLSLALVLFLDAITLDTGELRRNRGLALRVLGPGTLLSAAVIALLARLLLPGISLPGAAILGAALASTDPVLLRGLVRRPDIHAAGRLALRLESGLNDVVLLPIVVVAMSFLAPAAAGPSLSRVAFSILLVGPLAGAAVGFLAVSALTVVRKRTGIRRDYESIYSLGVAFTAFAAAEALHGSGFLAAFAAGLTIVLLDVELCDCFVEYGETTAELALLFTFVLFGCSAIWIALDVLDLRTVLFAVLALLVRPLVYAPSLAGSGVDRAGRRLIGWFGPRGLSSLLLVLLPVFAGLPGAVHLFAVCAVVVLGSVVVHGASLLLLRRRVATTTAAPAPPAADPIRISVAEARALAGAVFVDVRKARTAEDSTRQIAGALRIDPVGDVVAQARALDLPRDRTLALYCA